MEPDLDSTPGPPPQAVSAQVVQQVPAPAARRRSRLWLPLMMLFFLFLLAGLAILGIGAVGLASLGSLQAESRIQEKHFSHVPGAPNKIAILSIEGAILRGEGFFKRQIDRARADKRLKAIVLRVNSPGGTITASDYMLHHLKKLAKEREIPIVVSMGGIAASGGYYVSMSVGDQPDSIFAEPTTWTGSIGVIIPHYDLSKMLNDKLGVEEDSIASHRLKGMGSMTKKMTDEEEAILQGLVDDAFARFKSVVQDGRPQFKKDPAALTALATGQVYAADQAVENGLVDKIGFLVDALERAIALAGVDKDDVEVVKYKPEPTLADVLLGVQAQKPTLDLSALLDMTVPRAYYLCTRMPPVLVNRKMDVGL